MGNKIQGFWRPLGRGAEGKDGGDAAVHGLVQVERPVGGQEDDALISWDGSKISKAVTGLWLKGPRKIGGPQ